MKFLLCIAAGFVVGAFAGSCIRFVMAKHRPPGEIRPDGTNHPDVNK